MGEGAQETKRQGGGGGGRPDSRAAVPSPARRGDGASVAAAAARERERGGGGTLRPRPAHLEALQLLGDEGLGLGQRRVAALDALVHLLHGGPLVLAARGAAAEHQALRGGSGAPVRPRKDRQPAAPPAPQGPRERGKRRGAPASCPAPAPEERPRGWTGAPLSPEEPRPPARRPHARPTCILRMCSRSRPCTMPSMASCTRSC